MTTYNDTPTDPRDDTPVTDGDYSTTITERFEAFHAANPRFYSELVTLARRFRTRTGRQCGIQRLIEIVRFDLDMHATLDDPEDFKVSNDYGAYYARLIMHQETDLAGFFEIRRSHDADQWIALLKHGLAA